MERHGADIGDAIRLLGLEDATVVGQSMGGNSIWALLSQGGSAGIRDVVIIDQTPKMLNSDDWPYGFYDYDATNATTFFAESIPNPGRHSLASKGPVRVARLLRGMDLKAAKIPFTPAELELLNDHASPRLATGDRGVARARAVRRRPGERLLAERARRRIRRPLAPRVVGRDRQGRARDQHRAAQGRQRGAARLARALSAGSRSPNEAPVRTPCRG